MRNVTLGLIGTGRIGKLHAENILRIPGTRLKKVVDLNADKIWAENIGLIYAKTADAIYSDNEIDAVIICSPSAFHTDQIVKAAQAGKHIFCEKPIGFDPKTIVEALRVVELQGVKLQIGFNRRFDPDLIRLKQAIDSGEIGRHYLIRITNLDPAPPPAEYLSTSGGIFLDTTIHDFDLIRYLSGSEVKEIYSAGAVLIDPAIGKDGDVDTALTTLKLEDGAMALIHNSRQAIYGFDQRVEVFGSKGSMCTENRTQFQTVLKTSQGVVSDTPIDFFLERYIESFRAEIEEFIQVIREDRPVPVTGRDGIIPVIIGLAAKQSLREEKPVLVEYYPM
ncbi:MAG: inositol 2-dehydrogenase [Candidatus Marinimicrobia bacterium]|nr:inositol 2-dehydrogenase [Candidatus Neomarinimicrobiota bacterium]MCH8305179.1 inositol 2-dehydrogenase [Candidatus Neomarinimicrobiota bacterium]TFB11383.1 inositol 2-dehydrogenase [Candidatus Marinimicrobia bacterium MT.SAG.2]